LRAFVDTALSILLSLVAAFAQGASLAYGSIRGEVFTKSANGEPAVLSGVGIVLHGPVTKDTESDAQGAFAVDGLPPGNYEIEANAPGLYAALAVEVSAGTSSTLQVEMNGTAATSSVTVTETDASVAEESEYNTISQPVVEKDPTQEEKIESWRPQPLHCFEDGPGIFLTEDDRKWLKAMDCAFSRKVHHA
jgi:Carboxypeptidase regulatory-like domain